MVDSVKGLREVQGHGHYVRCGGGRWLKPVATVCVIGRRAVVERSAKPRWVFGSGSRWSSGSRRCFRFLTEEERAELW